MAIVGLVVLSVLGILTYAEECSAKRGLRRAVIVNKRQAGEALIIVVAVCS